MLLCAGCATLAEKSAGHIGCGPEEIVVDHEDLGRVHTWDAMCHGQVYVCSERQVGRGLDDTEVACAPKRFE
jgi:hypothetical protein